MVKRDDNLGYPDPQEMKERIVGAAKDGYDRGGALSGIFNGFVESRRVSREFNTYLHPTDVKRRAYYDRKREERS